MNAPLENGAWRLLGKPVVLTGFAFGSRYPVVVVTITGHALSEVEFSAVVNLLPESLFTVMPLAEKQGSVATPQDGFRVCVEWILGTLHLMQRAADLPVFERGRVLSAGPGRAKFYIPTGLRSVNPLLQCLLLLLELLEFQSQGKSIEDARKRFAQAVAELRKTSPGGANVPRFVQAAFEMGMPFQELPGQIFQYGQGKHGRWMDSSFTDETPQIAARLARHKQLAAEVLRQAGIPVPGHKRVADMDAALEVAGQLGYPVVVKPADLDGGVGVAAGLRDPDEVRVAFQSAQRYSKNILVEKHVEGKDYRVTVLHDKVIWAVERVPGGVTGDGRSTVGELLAQLNADPLRGAGRHAPLKRMPLDDEAAALLQRAGMDVSSVPTDGQFVRLRRTANVASGGTPVAVFDQVHADNRQLAIRAAQALRLDLAGVDLLIPDISRSWREIGAAVCEVNGQPGLGQTNEVHMYATILRELVQGDGRIPTVVLLGAPATSTLARTLESLLLQSHVGVGCHDARGVRVNGEVVLDGRVTPFAAGQVFNGDRHVDTVVLSINDASVLHTGLPFARFDVLLLAGPHLSGLAAVNGQEGNEAVFLELLVTLLPACDGRVLTMERSGLVTKGLEHLSTARWQHLPAEPGRITGAVMAALHAAQAQHERKP